MRNECAVGVQLPQERPTENHRPRMSQHVAT
jgi:hypothetical protein